MNKKTVSYVIPCYNEAAVLPEFYRRIRAVADTRVDYEFEFVFINDGSRDETPRLLNEIADQDPRVKVLHFARNMGHQEAITAGMDFSSGDIIVTIDADLQDPPELIDEILEEMAQGYDVIHMQRRKRPGESRFKLASSSAFYWLMKHVGNAHIVANSGDFRAFTRPVLEAMRQFREKHRFMRGLFAMIGFRQTTLQYDRDRRFAGQTKYPLRKMLRLASNAILSFSATPLHTIIWLSMLLWLASLIYLIKALVDHFLLEITVQGWTSIIILMTFYTGIILFCLSIIATYIGRIFEQGQHRPLYWLYDARNIDLREFSGVSRETRISSSILDSK
ncbi:glycosyltransferase family 2 protein [Thiolapillus sp.]